MEYETPEQRFERAVGLHRAGRLAEAEALYRDIIAQAPGQAEALRMLGTLVYQSGRPEEAARWIAQSLECNPRSVLALNAQGLILQALRRPGDALASYGHALELKPDFAEAYNNRGNARRELGRLEQALADYERALSLKSEYVDALNNRGRTLHELGRREEALACFDAALARKADVPDVLNNRGLVLRDLRRDAEALASFERALALDPRHAMALNNRGNALRSLGRLEEALSSFDQALEFKPDFAEAHNHRGNVLRDLCRLEEAQAGFERALALRPDLAEVFTSRLLGLLYQSTISPQAIHEEHLRFGERYETPLKPLWPRHANDRDPDRRLKVGYVSGDFRRHSVAYFMEPVLSRHDATQVEVYCYYNHTRQDAETARFQAYAHHWRACAGWTDERLARQILDDGIDVLIDLSGHTAGNRLLTFARKPAPVQVSYLGYAATTGLTAMDWRLTHADVDPAGYDACYTERLYRLPGSLWCYRPSPELGEVAAEPPLSTRGHVTFGSMNNLAKVSPETIAVWAEILQAMPDARLVMTNVPTGAAEVVRQRFARRGIEAARVTIYGKLPGADYGAVMQTIDVELDPFPYTGTTTTCDTLWQGIPVVSLVGDSAVARSGYALLKSIGLEELAVATPEAYVRTAVGLVRDPRRLADMRAGLRTRFAASPLRDEAGFTRALEAGYRSMWHAWCRSAG